MITTSEGSRLFVRPDMKPFQILFAFFVLACLSAVAQSPWVSQTGLTQDTLDSRLEHWADPMYDLEPACISGYEEGGVIRYAVLWTKPTDTQARRVVRGVTASSFISANALNQSLGYRLVWLNGFESSGIDYYNAIYRLSRGPAQAVRIGDSLSAHQSANTTLSSQGYWLDNVCVFRNGSSIRYGAWWNEGAISPQTYVSYGQTGADYQQEFNTRSGTWRLHNVCGYTTLLNEDRFTAVWRRPAQSGAWAASHGMSKENYFALQGNQTMVGRRPLFQQAWQNGSAVHFNGIWVDNGGLSGHWVNQLDTAVSQHMENNDIPGMTLAVSRRGQLMFARGYGFAALETSELAGPDHRFRIASVSKPVASVSILHTLENFPGRTIGSRMFGASGIFGTDYGSGTYSQREQDIRLRHLLHHTAGWPDDGKLWYFAEPSWGSEHKPIIDYQINSVTQTADPGDAGRYSNLGYVIAARVVEKLSGRTFEDYTVNEVLAECGIGGAYRMAVGERTRAQKKLLEASYYPHANDGTDPEYVDPRRMDGSTAWIARPMDLLLLARRFDGNATHTDILSAGSIADMRTPASPLPGSDVGYDASRYGLGWVADNINNPTRWSHNGGMAGTRADFVVRVDGHSYAWMANTAAGDLNGIIDGWINQVTAAQAWPDVDLFYTAHPAYDSWAASKFSTLDRGQPGLRVSVYGPDADPDDDHIPNAGEAYLGLDPLVANPSPLSVVKVGTNLRVRWMRSLTERGVTISLQTSTDLQNWIFPIGIPITDRPDLIALVGKQYQEVLIPITGSRRFARLNYRTH